MYVCRIFDFLQHCSGFYLKSLRWKCNQSTTPLRPSHSCFNFPSNCFTLKNILVPNIFALITSGIMTNETRENYQFREQLGPSLGNHTETVSLDSPRNLLEDSPVPRYGNNDQRYQNQTQAKTFCEQSKQERKRNNLYPVVPDIQSNIVPSKPNQPAFDANTRSSTTINSSAADFQGTFSHGQKYLSQAENNVESRYPIEKNPVFQEDKHGRNKIYPTLTESPPNLDLSKSNSRFYSEAEDAGKHDSAISTIIRTPFPVPSTSNSRCNNDVRTDIRDDSVHQTIPKTWPNPDPSNSTNILPETSIGVSKKCVFADRQNTSSQIGNNSEDSKRINQHCGESKHNEATDSSCSNVSRIQSNSVSSKPNSIFFVDNAEPTSPNTKTNLTSGTFAQGSNAIKQVKKNDEDQHTQQKFLDSSRKNDIPAFSEPTSRSNSINDGPGNTKKTISCSADDYGTLAKESNVIKVENNDRDQSAGQLCRNSEEFKANTKNDKPSYSKVLSSSAPLNSSSNNDSSGKSITAKNKSTNNSNDKNVKKPSTAGEEQISTPELLSNLKDELKTYYKSYCQWVKDKEWIDPKHKEVFPVRIQSRLEKKPKICGISDIASSGFKRVLVRSYGLFGKSALCNRIALSWSEGRKSQFDICSYIKLKYFDGKSTVEEYLISGFVSLLRNRKTCHKEAVEKALKTKSDKTLIMLDGLDSMSEEGQTAVREFLNDSGIFKKSTIILASRPSECIENWRMFDAYVDILGFDKDSFLKHARSKSSFLQWLPVRQNSKTIESLEKLNLSYLNGFPLPTIYEVLGSILEKKYCVNSLFELLAKIMESYSEPCIRHSLNTKEDMKAAFQKFGWICLDALASRCSSFEVKKVEEILGKHASLILNLGIFWEHCTADTKVVFCHQVFIVYFATLYLRNTWNKSQWKERIFKKLFCSKDCIGDYFVSNNQSYVVGFLPEIVLSVDPSCNLRTGHFEMYHDVIEKAAIDYAFHPVNLLLRSGEMFLRHFDIMKMNEKNGEKYDGILEKFLCYLSVFESCNIDYDLYDEKEQNRVFMAFTAVQECHQPQVIVQGIFLQNKDATYDNKMHIEFRLNMAKSVLPFLEKAVGLNLNESALSTQGNFLLSCLVAYASGPYKPATCISVQETFPREAFDRAPSRQISFYLWRTKHSSSFIEFRYWNPSSKKMMYEVKTVEELWENFERLASILNSFCDSYSDPSILINVF